MALNITKSEIYSDEEASHREDDKDEDYQPVKQKKRENYIRKRKEHKVKQAPIRKKQQSKVKAILRRSIESTNASKKKQVNHVSHDLEFLKLMNTNVEAEHQHTIVDHMNDENIYDINNRNTEILTGNLTRIINHTNNEYGNMFFETESISNIGYNSTEINNQNEKTPMNFSERIMHFLKEAEVKTDKQFQMLNELIYKQNSTIVALQKQIARLEVKFGYTRISASYVDCEANNVFENSYIKILRTKGLPIKDVESLDNFEKDLASENYANEIVSLRPKYIYNCVLL